MIPLLQNEPMLTIPHLNFASEFEDMVFGCFWMFLASKGVVKDHV